ncbi:CHRD domain-containing protein [Halalkalicoccus ordinarius]|uniref:CHRD domain-containing protein n=1 Tax=Halalkalicoccus ordinarius TaxID=3116651 RepID=UPI00300E9958
MSSNLNRRQVLSATGAAIVGSMAMSGQAAASSHGDQPGTYSAELSGDAEVPPVETDASGHATFEANEDETAVEYEVHVESICNVTQAHVHLGEEGENGPVVVWLYPEEGAEPELIEGRFDGTLAEGTITEDDFVGPLEGASFEEAAETLESEGGYVNVHTEQHPGGEIRGQIEPDEMSEEESEGGDSEESEDEQEQTREEDEGDEDEMESESEDENGSDDGDDDYSSVNALLSFVRSLFV